MLITGQIVQIDSVPDGPNSRLQAIKAGDKAVYISNPRGNPDDLVSIRVISGSAAGYEYSCFQHRLSIIKDSALARLKKMIQDMS